MPWERIHPLFDGLRSLEMRFDVCGSEERGVVGSFN